MRCCDVIVDVAHRNVDRRFTYSVPERIRAIEAGMWVKVPFAGRLVEGFVIEVFAGDGAAPEHAVSLAARDKLKPVSDVLDEVPVLLPHLMTLADWMRRRYHGLWVDSLRLLLPAGMRGGRVRVKTRRVARIRSEIGRDHASALMKRSPRQEQVYAFLQEGPRATGDVAACIPGAAAALRALEDKGLIEITAEPVSRTPYGALAPGKQEPFASNPAQAAALDAILPALDRGEKGGAARDARFGAGDGPFLLYGVTGSGKTEVYMHAIQRALEQGRTAILLVPEIALTPQMVDSLRARFPGITAVLHSRLTPGERMDEWLRLRSGEARLAVGARSAVFAPLGDLGIIVVDEEHEGSYISDHTPRYDAREVARFRCENEGGVLILGSATPSLETWKRVEDRAVEVLDLPSRVENRPMPRVEIVDMRRELIEGNRSVFSAALSGELAATVAAGRQAMLLLNRRGYAPFVSCRKCGEAVRCEACDVSMTYHQSEELMRCHWCDAVAPPPKVCPKCGSTWIRYFGLGTQKIEEELRALLPGVGVLRMDNDTTRGKDGHLAVLSAFREGKAQVLVGTQMIAKGHDFPRVTLAGILAADLSLKVADYRAEERTFQLITQMAGRAGRGHDPGLVIVQTYDPDHYAVQCGCRQDFRAFANAEMRRRRIALYPPFVTIARVLCASEDVDAARETAERFEARLKELLKGQPDLARAIVQARARTAPVERARGEYRYMLYVKMYPGESAETILDALAAWCRDALPCAAMLEVNPQSLL